jgi:RNA polymerase sigma factor (sigma-70 family)
MLSFRRHYGARAKRQVAREISLDDSRWRNCLRTTVAARTATPSSEAIEGERRRQIEAALNTLPPGYRQVVQRRVCDQLTFEAIGAELGCSADAARKLWTRALRHMAASLEA